jgi:Zn-dependent M28 family amino/carboxypeptidase
MSLSVVMKMYTNMTNIIVRLSCGPECDQNAILLNAHYDTTLGSPGATDDALGVGVQMELIRVLSQQPALKKNSVIFCKVPCFFFLVRGS